MPVVIVDLDRISGNEIKTIGHSIADMLGVKRDDLTKVARQFESDGLIEYTSDCIRVTNRAELEARVCECYAVVKKEYDALFADARTRATIG